MLKRIRPAPQGRAYRVRKRSNHVTIVIDRMDSHEEHGTDEESKMEE